MKNLKDYLAELARAEVRALSRAAPQPSRAKIPAKPPILELDPQCRARSVDAIAEKADRVAAAGQEADRAVSRVGRATRKAERQTGDGCEVGGTGHTILKRRETPLQRLLNAKRIGSEELQAAEDFDTAFTALAGALFCKSPSMERRDPGHSTLEPTKTIEAVARYRTFASVWTKRAKRGDPTLQILVAALVDGQPFREIEIELRLRNGAASRAVTAGLRDYAARAGWAPGRASRSWRVEEGSVFRLKARRPLETLHSMARRWDRERAA